MSGTVSVPNTFASAVTATGAQLDANYSTIVAYINDPTNRNNYAADGAATNTVILTFAPAVAGGYTAGLELTWKWGATNTGPVVINANGLGNASLVHADGTALAAGEGMVGSIGKAVSDGTRFIFITPTGTAASAAQVSAAATLVPYVSPGRMQNHPGVAKAYAGFVGTATGTITSGAFASLDNVTSVVRQGTGTYAINFTTPMADTLYAALVMSSGVTNRIQTRTTTQCVFGTFGSDGVTPGDFLLVSFVAFGNQ